MSFFPTSLWSLDEEIPIPLAATSNLCYNNVGQVSAFDEYFHGQTSLPNLQYDGAGQRTPCYEENSYGYDWAYKPDMSPSSSESIFPSDSDAANINLSGFHDGVEEQNPVDDDGYNARVAVNDNGSSSSTYSLQEAGTISNPQYHFQCSLSTAIDSDASDVTSFSLDAESNDIDSRSSSPIDWLTPYGISTINDPSITSHSAGSRGGGSTSENSHIPLELPLESRTVAQSSEDAFMCVASCNAAPADAIRKLVNSKRSRALLGPTKSSRGAPVHVEIDSVGPSIRHSDNAWKFFCTPIFLNGSRGTRQIALVCNNPLIPECDKVMGDCGSMRNHQTTRGHGAANLVCERCKMTFNTGRLSALHRHLESGSCDRRQRKMAKVETERAKKVRKPMKERKTPV